MCWTERVYLLSGWTHWHWQLEEKDGEDPNSAVVTYVRRFSPFNDPTMGFLSNAVRRQVHAAYAVTVLALICGASPLARSAMALDFEAVAISMIAAGKTFRIAALPMAFKPKGSKKGTLVQGAGACIGRPLYVWPVSGCVVVGGGV